VSKNSGNILLVALILVGILAASVGGYFLWYKMTSEPIFDQPLTWEQCLKTAEAKIQQSFPPICVTKNGIKVAGPVNNDMANWKTYTDTQFGVSFKYPENWYVKMLDSKTIIISDMQTDIKSVTKIGQVPFVIELTEDQGFINQFKKRMEYLVTTDTLRNKTVINSFLIADYRSHPIEAGIAYKEGDAFNKNVVYRFILSKVPGYEEYFDQILSTFKFIEQK